MIEKKLDCKHTKNRPFSEAVFVFADNAQDTRGVLHYPDPDRVFQLLTNFRR